MEAAAPHPPQRGPGKASALSSVVFHAALNDTPWLEKCGSVGSQSLHVYVCDRMHGIIHVRRLLTTTRRTRIILE